MTNSDISSTRTWKALRERSVRPILLREAFNDKTRSQSFTYKTTGWTVDFSRQLIDTEVLSLLLELARVRNFDEARKSMFRGDKINKTEDRAALHIALRSPPGTEIKVDGHDVVKDVQTELNKMISFTRSVLEGSITGHTGKKYRYVVVIGIGGSNLGPEMACNALSAYGRGLDIKFVSNVDPTDLKRTLDSVDAEETLFVVVSKSFTTPETMQNARAAREWLISQMGDSNAISDHFTAVSTNEKLLSEFGIPMERTFGFWDWVGGRYSMTSTAGFPLMLGIGPDNFMEMLSGFRDMDIHYLESEPASNVPLLMALSNFWNTTFLGMQTHGVIAYDEYLALLPDHLQQLVMESLGKRVTTDGATVDYPTCPVFFGGVGTNVQHSYFQMLHQGAGVVVPIDFIGCVESLSPLGTQHNDLFLNMVAQANVMAFGELEADLKKLNTAPELIPHKLIPGNKPSTVLITRRLTPRSLGQLVALFEHMVHAWGTILGINAFDQFGVEAGKRKASELGKDVTGTLTEDTANRLLQST